jgi:DNA-binding transcriptional MerR regulator
MEEAQSMEIHDVRFSLGEVARLLGAEAATLRSWQKQGLVEIDPALSGRRRQLQAIDVLYLGLLKSLLSAGFKIESAAALAAGVLYGEDDKLQGASSRRVRACQHDYNAVRPEARHRDLARPFWLIHAGTDACSRTASVAQRSREPLATTASPR